MADPTSYAALLTLQSSFHTAAESALDRMDGWGRLTPGTILSARRRAPWIEQCLVEMDAPAPVLAGPIDEPTDMMWLTSMAAGLGCLYLIEAAGPGAPVIAALARAALDPRLPTSFFADPDRHLGQDCNGLPASLDAFAAAETGAATGHVINAARQTFATFGAVIAEERMSR